MVAVLTSPGGANLDASLTRLHPASTSTCIAAHAPLTAFANAFIALPPELRTHILLFLSPDDLGVLSRVVEPLEGIERDHFLWTTWISQTAPSRVGHALFSPLSLRPDPTELVRRGTLRGVAVVSGVRAGGYWASPSAVRLSRAHDTISRVTLRRSLSTALAARPSRLALVAKGILPPSAGRAEASICARAFALDRQRARDEARRALRASGVGSRNVPDRLESSPGWHDAGRAERVVLALCPGIRQKRRFFENLGAVQQRFV
ncbi:uncharacterized protein EHS24_002698 [Apiotrichum porosum]|uniref:F-box domain-containing protein n=1 Tax=Apiotrichum porosum TaxID=105984 RepID=A0A427XHN0_9TREE|nr:uncharacterized protein EHS24_002698 [Apiotrichum porosum]RSH78234.1 hypothetical protein EHS24_002698 [Apiotrichum porosum]